MADQCPLAPLLLEGQLYVTIQLAIHSGIDEIFVHKNEWYYFNARVDAGFYFYNFFM